MENARVKKASKIDYDKVFEERQAKLAGIPTTVDSKKSVDTKGLSTAAKGIILEQEAERGLADQLFGDVDEEARGEKVKLSTEKEYKNYGKNVAKNLFTGETPYNVPVFYKELMKGLQDNCESKHIKAIVDSMTTVYNEKCKKEKEEASNKNKKKKANLKGGGGKGYELNNNPAMINDVLGGAEDDYGDYGNEAGFKRASEATYDFM